MGMSASQARLLSLQARQSDLEYQGQQINQERSVLSQQVTGLYNSLLTMTVPTPPSTSDYTTVEYAGTIGATAYTFDASSIKPNGRLKDDNGKETDQKYTVTVFQSSYGDSLEKSPNIATVNNAAVQSVTVAAAESSKGYTETEIETLYIENADGTVTKASKDIHFTKNADGTYKVKDDYKDALFVTSTSGQTKNIKTSMDNVTVAGHSIYTMKDAADLKLITKEQKDAYATAIKQCGLTKPDGTPYGEDDFFIFFNDKGETCFVMTTDIADGNDNAVTYNYIANGNYRQSTTYADCKLEFDPTSGRITSISLPNYAKDASGQITSTIESWTTMEVAATTITDDTAYEDAYNKYEYAKYQYDKTQQDINAKTEVIQQMDRNLELKLQRLDDERKQITAEIEALDKVISENIDSSYKTFSG